MRLKTQIFLTLLMTGVILITLMYLISSWSFSRGFLDYLNQSEHARLAPMISDLSEKFEQQGSWDWIAQDKQAWRTLINKHVMTRPPPPNKRRPSRPDTAENGNQKPDRNRTERRKDNLPGPLTLDPRLLLADANKNLIIGKARAKSQITWQPINLDDTVVGFLGYRPRQQLTNRFDQLFEKQQKRSFAYAALATIVLSALLSIPLASRIVNPVLTINRAVDKISQGNYQHKIDLKRSDELGTLAADINTLSHTLEQNQSSRQRWIAEISHELRTPVAVLQAELEAIEDGIRPLDHTSVESLQQETLRLKRLIDDLHDLSLSDLGALNYKMETLELTSIVQEFLGSRTTEADAKKINLRYLPGQAQATIKGDLQRLVQLLQNLFQNSLHYTDVNGQIEVSVNVQQNLAILNWSDSSPGVDDEQLGLLLEPLHRVDASRNRHTGGAGLGLAIVSKIVAAHQGEIKLMHASLGGITVEISLPLKGKANL